MVQARPSREGGKPGSTSYDNGGAGGYILAGLLIFGGLGLWLDRLLDLSFLTPLGLVLGAVAGGYLVYVRVVRAPAEPTQGSQTTGSSDAFRPDEGETR